MPHVSHSFLSHDSLMPDSYRAACDSLFCVAHSCLPTHASPVPLLQFDPGMPQAGRFWSVFWPSVTANVGYWATLSLNIPDFTRYGRSQRAQVVGQALGLPLPMALFTFLGERRAVRGAGSGLGSGPGPGLGLPLPVSLFTLLGVRSAGQGGGGGDGGGGGGTLMTRNALIPPCAPRMTNPSLCPPA